MSHTVEGLLDGGGIVRFPFRHRTEIPHVDPIRPLLPGQTKQQVVQVVGDAVPQDDDTQRLAAPEAGPAADMMGA